MPANRLALVFSGGGAKGAFGAGVLAQLTSHIPELRWSIVTGTSTGALITPFAVLGRDESKWLSILADFYVRAKRDDIAKPLSLFDNLCRGAKGLSSLKPLRSLVGTVLTDGLDDLARSDVPGIVTTVNLQEGRLYLCVQDQFRDEIHQWYRTHALPVWGMIPEVIPFSQFLDTLVASCAVPFASEPIDINGYQFVDGGVFDKAPLRAALAAGATHAIVVMMSPPPAIPTAPRKYKNILAVAMRAIELLQEEVVRGDLDALAFSRRFIAMMPTGLRVAAAPQLLDALQSVAPYAAIDNAIPFAVVEPAYQLGETMDFDSKVRTGWPEMSTEGAKIRIMEGRFEYGRRRTEALLCDPTSNLVKLLTQCGYSP